eukprot:3150311-Amphidinium_carterae.1
MSSGQPTLKRNSLGNLVLSDEGWRSDRKLVLQAVRERGAEALRCAAKELRGDPEIVVAAVQIHAFALEHATDA